MLLDGICKHNMQKSRDLWHCFRSDPLEMSHSQSESTLWNLISVPVTFLPSQTTDINVWTRVLLLLSGGPVRQETHSWMDRWAMLLWINLDFFWWLLSFSVSCVLSARSTSWAMQMLFSVYLFPPVPLSHYLQVYSFFMPLSLPSFTLRLFFSKLLSSEIPSHSRDLTNICFSCLPVSSSGLILPRFTL